MNEVEKRKKAIELISLVKKQVRYAFDLIKAGNGFINGKIGF